MSADARLPQRAGLDPGRTFLALTAAFGLAFLVLTPPMQVPDELRHLTRAFMIAQGEPFAVQREGIPGHFVPRSVAEMDERLGAEIAFHAEHKQDVGRVLRELSVSLDEDDRVFEVIPSVYSPVAYLPQSVAAWITRVADAPPILAVYLGRLLNLAAFAFLTSWAIRIAPAHRWVLAMLAVTPMSLFLAASLSADVVTNGLAALLVASVLRMSRAEGPIERRELAALFALTLLLGLTKPTYAALVALSALIPARRFASPGRRWGSLLAVALLAIAPGALWLIAVARLDVPVPPWHKGADPPVQLRLVLSQPLFYASVLLRSLRWLSFEWTRNFVGSLGHFDVWLPQWLYVAHPAALLSLAVFDGGRESPIDRRGRLVALATAALTWALVVTAGYVGWNAVGRRLLWGVQGRYFIPIAPLLLMSVHWSRSRGLPPDARLAAAVFCAAVLTIAVALLAIRYYAA